MPQKNISKDIPFTSTKFKFSVDDGLQFPNRINPTFPPFCVQCGQPATEYVEEVGQARKQVGNAQYGETSGGRRGTQTNYLVTKMVVKVPFCLSHAEDTRRRKKIGNTSLGISVGISVFIAICIIIINVSSEANSEIKSYNNILFIVLLTLGMIVTGAILYYYLYKIRLRRLHIDKRDWFHIISLTQDDITLIFHNASYAKKFTEANNWEPSEPTTEI